MKKIVFKLLDYPKAVLLAVAVLSLFSFLSIKEGSRMETDLDEYMPQKHPAFVYSNQAEEWFDIRDSIIIAIENREGIYNPGSLQKVVDLTKALGKFDEIDKADITSLSTADNITGTEYGLDVKPFFKKVPSNPEELENLKTEIRGNDMVYGRLVSVDETVTVIIASLDDDDFTDQLYSDIRELARSFEGPETVHVAGRPIVEGTMAYLAPRDMKKMVPIVILIIALILFTVLRSARAAFFTLMVVLVSTVWTFGLMAALDIPVYAVSTMIPVMLIAIGVADGIHLYNHLHLNLYRQNKPAALPVREHVLEMVNSKINPVIMTSVTTAVGFISLLTSQVYPIKYFGLFTAFGVMAAMVLSLLFIPASILVFGMPGWKKAAGRKTGSRGTARETGDKTNWSLFADRIFSFRYIIAFSAALILAVSVFGMTKVWIDSSFLSNFEKESEIVVTDTFINSKFGGTSTLNVILESDRDDAFKEPEILEALDKMQKETEESLEVAGDSFSIADYLRRMNMVMNADSPEYNVVPDSRELSAQYLLLYEMSGDPENLWKVTDVSYRKANLTFQLKSDSSRELRKTIDIIENHAAKFDSLGITLNYAGSGYKGLVFTDLILKGQIASVMISLLIVAVLLSLMFRNMKAGIVGSVPIVITAFTGFGIMGLFSIPLTTTTALLSSIAIGIGIDFAVHFIDQYRSGIEKTGSMKEAGEIAMNKSGRALLFNAFVVISGFIVLLFSVFPPNRALGALVSLNMATSLAGTLTIMYVMLLKFKIFSEQGPAGPESGVKK